MKKEESKLMRAASVWQTFCAGMLVGAALLGLYCRHIGVVDRGHFTLIFVIGYPFLFFAAFLPRLLVEIHLKLKKLKAESDETSQNNVLENIGTNAPNSQH